MKEIDFNDIAHEIWAVAQLIPQEGIEEGVLRIEDLLINNFKQSHNKPIEPAIEARGLCQMWY